MYLEGVEGPDVTTGQKPEHKGEEAATTVEAKIFQAWKRAKDNCLQETFLSRKV